MTTRPDNGEPSAPADDVIDRLRRLGPAQSKAFKARLHAGRLRGHDIVARSPQPLGVTHLYAMPGLPTDETIGAAHACPERPVIVVTGDMALSLNFFEFETAERHAVPVVVVLANNDGPSGARRQRSAFPAGHDEHVLEYQAGLRYDEMARPLGVVTACVDTIDELPEALARALSMRRPPLLQMQVAPLDD